MYAGIVLLPACLKIEMHGFNKKTDVETQHTLGRQMKMRNDLILSISFSARIILNIAH